MARTTLRGRLTFLFGATIMTVIFLVGWFLSQHSKKVLVQQARLTGIALTRSIAASASNDLFSYNYVALEQKAEESAKDSNVAYVILYNKEGEVAAFSGQGVPGMVSNISSLTPDSFKANEPVVTMQMIEGYAGRGLDVLIPVVMPTSQQRWGAVRLGMRLDSIYSQINRMIWMIFALGLAGVAIGWAVSAYFTQRITVPLKGLVDATVKVSSGDLETSIIAPTGDEIQDLAENFNQMVNRLKKQRDELEDNLREIGSLKHFSDLIILSITNGLITLDDSGLITSFNRKAEEILMMEPNTVLQKNSKDVWDRENDLGRIIRLAMEDGETVSNLEVPWVVEGKELVLELSTALIQEMDSSPVGLIVLFNDLTEKKALEDRVRRADRLAAMGTLASGLAHEIRNPLTAVRAFVQMFPQKHQQKTFTDKFNRIVPRELDRVNDLIDHLLDLVRKPKLKIEKLKVSNLMVQILETLEPEIKTRAIQVQNRSSSGEESIWADEAYLSRGLYNIMLNAVQVMPDGGTLTIETEVLAGSSRQELAIRISDTGVGIPEDQIDEIFNPFFTSKEKGTGLGLAVTNKIIEDQQGRIAVESQRGQGTTFTVILPVVLS